MFTPPYKLTPLYKLDSKGNVREWSIACFTFIGDTPKYVIRHGLMEGKQQTKTQLVTKGKNIGRTNETNAQQQCVLEAQSKWTKQRDRKGYSEEIPTCKQFGPMLAKTYAEPGTDLTDLKDGKHIDFPCYYQPKLDGIRCLASWEDGKVVLRSRRNKKWSALPHIEKELFSILCKNQDIILDGELYIHNEYFQDLTSAIKRDEANDESHKIEYHVYDYYNKNKPSIDFDVRNLLLINLLYNVGSSIKRVDTYQIIQSKQIQETLKKWINKGYEGIMLRNKRSPYKVDGRSQDLQKVKIFIDGEFEIIGAVENPKKRGTCSFVCVTEEGYEFKCTPKGTDEQRQQYWDNWRTGIIHPGNMLTCRFFSFTTSEQPVPWHAVGVCIRDYE